MHRYIKAVGAGQKRARALTLEEAEVAMGMILEGAADPVQVGAFLLALRMKGETPEEIAGFASAVYKHSHIRMDYLDAIEIDAHGDGHEGLPSLLPAAACAAVASGIKVVLALDTGQPFAHHGLDDALKDLGFGAELTPERALSDLEHVGLAVVSLERAFPALRSLLALRPLLGVRTAMQTVAKLVSPWRVAARLVGVFHAPYLPQTAAALALVEPGCQGLVVQQIGGLPEARPGKRLRVMRPGQGPETLEIPASDALEPASLVSAVEANRAALEGESEHFRAQAAATAALMIHVQTGTPMSRAHEEAAAAFASGRARAVYEDVRARS